MPFCLCVHACVCVCVCMHVCVLSHNVMVQVCLACQVAVAAIAVACWCSLSLYYKGRARNKLQQALNSSRDWRQFGHNRHGWKVWGLCPFLGVAGPHLTQCGLGQGLPSYQVASWSIQPFGHNRHGPKSGVGCAHFLQDLGPPSNTRSPGPRPTSVLSGILIHPAVWP